MPLLVDQGPLPPGAERLGAAGLSAQVEAGDADALGQQSFVERDAGISERIGHLIGASKIKLKFHIPPRTLKDSNSPFLAALVGLLAGYSALRALFTAKTRNRVHGYGHLASRCSEDR